MCRLVESGEQARATVVHFNFTGEIGVLGGELERRALAGYERAGHEGRLVPDATDRGYWTTQQPHRYQHRGTRYPR